MRKIIASILISIFMALIAQAETANDDVGEFGIGYQGLFLGDFYNGISVRYCPEATPLMAQLIYSRLDGDDDDENGSVDIVQTRMAYILKQRENSKFYIGGKLGYITADLGDDDTMDGISYGLLFGTEFNFTELPEIGFNFDVGYDFTSFDTDDSDVDISGVNVTFGAHYYF